MTETGGMDQPIIITLLTDFGLRDSYVAQMKGVILGIAPDVRIVDVTHEVPPQDVGRAARILESIIPVYPVGTIHACVVDPGVGSARRFLLVKAAKQWIIAPDNGLVEPLVRGEDSGVEIRELSETWFRRSPLSSTFHGRDLVAPAAAHLANGTAGERFGEIVTVGMETGGIVPLRVPVPTRTAEGVRGEVTDVDHFGNLLTNLTVSDWRGVAVGEVRVSIGGRMIEGVGEYYAQVEPGELIALVSSFGTLEIACRNGNAAELLGAGRGTVCELRYAN